MFPPSVASSVFPSTPFSPKPEGDNEMLSKTDEHSSPLLQQQSSFETKATPPITQNTTDISGSEVERFEPVCRICAGGSDEGELIAPCKCTGSIQWIHRECLDKWRINSSVNPQNLVRCEVCHHPYEFETHVSSMRLYTHLTIHMLCVVCAFLVASLCVGLVVQPFVYKGFAIGWHTLACGLVPIFFCMGIYALVRMVSESERRGGWAGYLCADCGYVSGEAGMVFVGIIVVVGIVASVVYLIAVPMRKIYDEARMKIVKSHKVLDFRPDGEVRSLV
eukprot:GDKI01021532.1.p1 GENE.GDKI01021532.1~~GDKI01021532.1.p1  ORF type:complete len:277 (-),score=26.61 GDKI01021532.1:21-851(-)